MIYRHFVRDGQIAETRRQELIEEVARQFAIREAREPKPIGQRPFAAPGSFLVFLKRHLAILASARPRCVQVARSVSERDHQRVARQRGVRSRWGFQPPHRQHKSGGRSGDRPPLSAVPRWAGPKVPVTKRICSRGGYYGTRLSRSGRRTTLPARWDPCGRGRPWPGRAPVDGDVRQAGGDEEEITRPADLLHLELLARVHLDLVPTDHEDRRLVMLMEMRRRPATGWDRQTPKPEPARTDILRAYSRNVIQPLLPAIHLASRDYAAGSGSCGIAHQSLQT